MKEFQFLKKTNNRAIGWLLIAIYTIILPDAILIYQKIVSLFGQEAAGKIPIIAAGILGLFYVFMLFRLKRNWKNLFFLIPCGLIALAIFTLEPNPNKHIHIPEYVLMAWLLYWVLSRDIKGRQILLLVFILAALLGVTDELEQGIHPARFYGASDMLVNASSALVGVFTIMGLTSQKKSDWGWLNGLPKMKWLSWMTGVGIVLVLLMCINLFKVQTDNEFWGIYPTGLWVGNILYLISLPIFMIHYFQKIQGNKTLRDKSLDVKEKVEKDTRLWVIPMLVILFYMQALIVYVSLAWVEFG